MRTTINTAICTIVAICGVAGTTLGYDAARAVEDRRISQAVVEKIGVTNFTIQELTATMRADQTAELSIHLGDSTQQLVLQPRSIRAPRFRVRIQSAQGQLVEVTPPPSQTYRGYVAGVGGSGISASIVNGKITAAIDLGESADDFWIIQPLEKIYDSAPASSYVVYRESDVPPDDGTCATETKPFDHSHSTGSPSRLPGLIDGRICEIACDADYEFYLANNSSVDDTVADIESIINGASYIYEFDNQLAFQITEIIVRTAEPDPYNTTNPYSLLDVLMDHWNNNHGDVHRDGVHLFTGRDLAGSPIGIAYQDSICFSTSYSLVQSHYSTDFGKRVALSAHELGHTFDARHCEWTEPWCRIMCPRLGDCSAAYHSFGDSAKQLISDTLETRGCFERTALDLPRTHLPLIDDFSYSGEADPSKWTMADEADVTGGTLYGRLEIDVGGGWDDSQDLGTIRTLPMTLPGPGTLSFGVRSGTVKAGDSLKVEYFNTSLLQWQELDSILSDGVDPPDYVPYAYSIPADGFGDFFAVRLSGYGNNASSGDEWRVDNFAIVPVTWDVDYDLDRDVDLDDFSVFLSCISGPEVTTPQGACSAQHHEASDLDDDGDVDLDDTNEFLAVFTGVPVCGNGSVEGEEWCDDSGQSAACDADCTLAECGDGTINVLFGEQCDDGWETVDCDLDCTVAFCGDTTINTTRNEECDDGGESYDCDSDCTVAECRDGTVNVTRGEECDEGGATENCDWDCTFVVCGDGALNWAAGERCEPPDGIHCDEECHWICGDYVVQYGEDCDPPNGETCDDNCQRIPSCGDGFIDDGEDCDDEGESATCDDNCTFVECGDSTVNVAAGEGCDDGNTDDGDGCSSECQYEGSLPNCVIYFDDTCPADSHECGVVFDGEGRCLSNGNCAASLPRAYRLIESQDWVDLHFLGDLDSVSFYLSGNSGAGGTIEFYDADYNYVDGTSTSGDCYQTPPTQQTIIFSTPVRHAFLNGFFEEGGAVWLDTLEVNP